MSLMVKFGQTILVKENIHNIFDEIKKTEWTENKIYKSASDIEIAPTFETRQKNIENISQHSENFKNFVTKIKLNRDILEKIGNVYFSKEMKSEDANNFNNFHKTIMDTYYDDNNLTRKRNMASLLNSFSNLKHISDTDKSLIKQIDITEISKFKNSIYLDFISKYKHDLLLNHDYNKLNFKEKENIKFFLENEVKKKYGITDINSFNRDINKNTNPYDHVFDDILCGYEKNQNNDSEKLIQRLILYNDFRSYVKFQALTDNQISHYFKNTNDIKKAAELYFQDVYGSKKLNVIYVFPDGRKVNKDFDLIATPDELYAYVFCIDPNYYSFQLIKPDGSKIEINPVTDKFIGGLKLPSNVKLIVKI